MAELGQLKKRLRGVELSGQLAGAVKTAASAKLSVLNRLYSSYRTYTEELESIVNPLLAHDEGSSSGCKTTFFMHGDSPSGSSTPDSSPSGNSTFGNFMSDSSTFCYSNQRGLKFDSSKPGGSPSGDSTPGGSPADSSTPGGSPFGSSSSGSSTHNGSTPNVHTFDSSTLGSSTSEGSSPGGSSSGSSPSGNSPFGNSTFDSFTFDKPIPLSPVERYGDSDGNIKPYYIIIGHNKGLCGSFNSELHSYADEYIAKHGDGKLYVCGKCAIAYFEGKTTTEKTFVFSDIPKAEQCKPLFDQIIHALMFEGATAILIYQRFINTLTQTPAVKILNPPAKRNYNKRGRKNTEVHDIICVPDRMTVETEIQRKFYETILYKIVLESALSAQSATLTAMRTAYDNAVETAETLENEINKTRQRAVTTGVLETAFGMASEWEEEENGIRE